MIQDLKISSNRIGVLIGKGGVVKRMIEEKTQTQLRVESQEGVVTIEGEEPALFMRAVEMVNAINRGFSPERAAGLLENDDLVLDIIDLSSIADTPGQMDRIRGRIIGKDGRAREQIEHVTDTAISVFGKTVALIGLPEQVKTARTAIDMLINGVPHESVFAFLDRKRREAKQDMISYYY